MFHKWWSFKIKMSKAKLEEIEREKKNKKKVVKQVHNRAM